MLAQKKNLELFNEAEVVRHLSFLFDGVEFTEGQYLCLRGIGEKGTSQEGNFREEFFFEPAGTGNGWKYGMAEHCARWAQFNVASFIIPCVLKARKATAENCDIFTTLVADFDSGDTDEKLRVVAASFCSPHLVVASGGKTESGSPKVHAWWKIEPTRDIQSVINTRHKLAEKFGADMMLGRGVASNPFGRAHQPIRLAGTVHSKHGKASAVQVVSFGGQDIVPLRAAEALSALDGVASLRVSEPQTEIAYDAPPAKPPEPKKPSVTFSPESGNATPAFAPVDLTTPVHEGGTDRTRFSEFGRVAGHYLHAVREGQLTMDEAYNSTMGWVTSSMIPPWPENRVRSEWEALAKKDAREKGAFSKESLPPDTQSVDAAVLHPVGQKFALPPTRMGISDLRELAAHRWATQDIPAHVHLVENLMLKGEPHLFVAEGGAGKTGLLVDLAMKLAAFEDGDEADWCGQKIRSGGPVILILCEDSKTEMHIRMRTLDRRGLIEKAGDKLIVLPMTVLGGAFPLAERDHKTGGSVTSSRWSEMLELIRKLPEPPCLVAIDTLNSVSHGDENSNVVVAEMMREAHRICGEFGAALLFNHHIRKSSEPLRSLEDLKNAIRGASAIPSYFRINFGIFHAGDYERRMRAMGLVPKRGQMWKFGICKANIHGLLQTERTLLRGENGILADVTPADSYAAVNIGERMAWLLLAVRMAAINLHPYSNGGKNCANGLYKRRTELPPILRGVGWREFSNLTESALQSGHLILCAIRGSKSKVYLDVPDGVLASDDAGVVINAGAYSTVPEWSEFYFDSDAGEAVKGTSSTEWNKSFKNNNIASKPKTSDPREDTDEDTDFASDLI